MKFTFSLAAAMLIFLAGFNYGLKVGKARCERETESYRNLYYQAIQWQELELENLPRITRNSQLKEK
jgi:hypothetical protein